MGLRDETRRERASAGGLRLVLQAADGPRGIIVGPTHAKRCDKGRVGAEFGSYHCVRGTYHLGTPQYENFGY